MQAPVIAPNLNEMPLDIIIFILKKLNEEQLCNMKVISRKFRIILQNSDIWNYPEGLKPISFFKINKLRMELNALAAREGDLEDYISSCSKLKTIPHLESAPNDYRILLEDKLNIVRNNTVNKITEDYASCLEMSRKAIPYIPVIILLLICAITLYQKIRDPRKINDITSKSFNEKREVIDEYLLYLFSSIFLFSAVIGLTLNVSDMFFMNSCYHGYYSKTILPKIILQDNPQYRSCDFKYYIYKALSFRHYVALAVAFTLSIILAVRDPFDIIHDECMLNLNDNCLNDYIIGKTTLIIKFATLMGATSAYSAMPISQTMAEKAYNTGKDLFKKINRWQFFNHKTTNSETLRLLDPEADQQDEMTL